MLAFVWLWIGPFLAAPTAAQQAHLLRQKAALEHELRLVEAHPEAYYLVIDLSAGEIVLKSGARTLRACPIRSYSADVTTLPVGLRLVHHIPPQTSEPGNGNLRLRGRRLPLDFVGRLTEGPRRASRLYLTPSCLLQPAGLHPPDYIPSILLDGADIKALASALQPGGTAILIPPASTRRGDAP